MQVGLDTRAGVRARRQALGKAQQDVHQRYAAGLGDHFARERQCTPREHGALARELEEVRSKQVAEVDVFERRFALARDDAHHLLRRDAVGAQRGNERAGRRTDVNVELVDAAVDREQVQRAQRADLIDAAGEATATEHQGRLVAARAPAAIDRAVVPDTARSMHCRPALLCRNLGLIRRFQLDNLAHPDLILRDRCPRSRSPGLCGRRFAPQTGR